MLGRRRLVPLIVFAALFGVCQTASANSISPYVWFWPGVLWISPFYALPASLLAAFIERPFLTAAGIQRHALVLSIRANCVSTVVGIALIPLGYLAFTILAPIWSIPAFSISCIVEIWYLRRFDQSFSRGWIIGGNAVSSLLLVLIPPVTLLLKQHHPDWAWKMQPYESVLGGLVSVASVAVFLASFAWSVKPKQGEESSVSSVLQDHVFQATGEDVQIS
jgi:hypothetical protein